MTESRDGKKARGPQVVPGTETKIDEGYEERIEELQVEVARLKEEKEHLAERVGVAEANEFFLHRRLNPFLEAESRELHGQLQAFREAAEAQDG